MARITGGTVQQQACMKEQFEKEEAAALQFFLQNIDKSTTPSGASSVLRKKLERTKIDSVRCNRLADEAAKRAEEAAKLTKQHTKEMCQSMFTSEYLSSQLDMRPASPKTKALLYDGISHDRRGRYQYLKARYQKEPEEKFPFPLPTSWDYGWRLSQSLKGDTVKKSPYGHVSIVRNTFFNRTGISFGETPEPKPWYSC
ncbi:hypothetical protein PHET_08162 [Paragonimus heterotremus]|uniref:Sperm microtubule inner protein 1 C-terminal domain-containing protein n=1 Tax=Paragonimus heterotremus TaxID=100268 RepID=A0A8J4WVS5_9TREM|nr:hypothetical protein PHET_08162 [Paragonimus heterotremus]